MRAIGLSGFAQTGKTTAANYIEARYGFRRVHIATTLRSMLAVLLRDLGYNEADIFDILEGSRKDGWTIPELERDSRHLQITIGTEWGREFVHPDIWVKTWTNLASQYDRAMNDSVRFGNEEQAIKNELGGFTIMIERPGTRPAKFTSWDAQEAWESFERMFPEQDPKSWPSTVWDGVHPSERIDLLNPTYTIVNDGSLEDLHQIIDAIMQVEGIAPLAEAA